MGGDSDQEGAGRAAASASHKWRTFRPVRQGPQCNGGPGPRRGRVAAGRTVPRRARRPSRHLRRALASNAGAYARRPQTSTMWHDRRATSEPDQQEMRTPTAGRPCLTTGTGRAGGTLSPGRPGLWSCRPEAECARGPWQERPRPQEQGREDLRDRARPQPRSASRGVAGCPRLKGSAETARRLRRRGRPSPRSLHRERFAHFKACSCSVLRGAKPSLPSVPNPRSGPFGTGSLGKAVDEPCSEPDRLPQFRQT